MCLSQRETLEKSSAKFSDGDNWIVSPMTCKETTLLQLYKVGFSKIVQQIV